MTKYELQKTTLWSFPSRGSWASHKGDYRGNWSPHVPRNLILKYTKEQDVILDCFVGSGTTLIEAKLLNRNAIGVDINAKALEITKQRLTFNCKYTPKISLIHGNAQNLSMINDSSIDFICTHPPYANIIHYSDGIENDLSNYDYERFLVEFDKASKELFRILKPNCNCSFMIGDIRLKGKVVPLGFLSMQVFTNNGFKLKEIIIKEQHNCHSTKYWEQKNINFYLLAHEYIFVFIK